MNEMWFMIKKIYTKCNQMDNHFKIILLSTAIYAYLFYLIFGIKKFIRCKLDINK